MKVNIFRFKYSNTDDPGLDDMIASIKANLDKTGDIVHHIECVAIPEDAVDPDSTYEYQDAYDPELASMVNDEIQEQRRLRRELQEQNEPPKPKHVVVAGYIQGYLTEKGDESHFDDLEDHISSRPAEIVLFDEPVKKVIDAINMNCLADLVADRKKQSFISNNDIIAEIIHVMDDYEQEDVEEDGAGV